MNDRVVIDYDSPEYQFTGIGADLLGLYDKKSWWHKAYWTVRRFFLYKLNPAKWYREIKAFIQRGRRGWADEDTWALGYNFAVRMRDAIEFSIPHQYGYPVELMVADDVEGEIGFANWQNINHDIAWGLDHYIAACKLEETCSCCGKYCLGYGCPIINEAFASLSHWWDSLGD